MTDDPHDGLSPSARALLRHAPAPRPRTAEERRRTSQRVARLAVAPAVAGGAWLSWKGGLLAATLVVAGGVGVAVVRRPPPPDVSLPAPVRVAPRAAPRPLPARTPPEYGPSLPPPVEAPPAPAVRSARPATVRPRPIVEGPPIVEAPPVPIAALAPAGGGSTPVVARPPEDEDHALARAQSLLASDPAEALRIVEPLTRESSAEERDFIALDALRRMGRVDALRSRGERFLQRFPRSLYAERVRRWLQP